MSLKIMLAQLNATVGDVLGNYQLASDAIRKAREKKADIIVFPELFLSGYPPKDLLYRPKFLKDIQEALSRLKQECKDIYCLMGHPLKDSALYNCASLLYNNQIIANYRKQCLSNEGVFDEKRYFTAGTQNCKVDIKGISVGIVICEDLWHPEPLADLAEQGTQLVLAPNASPFSATHHQARLDILKKYSKTPVVYVNLIGGQEDLVFDGGSMVIDAHHQICAQAEFFKETLLEVEIPQNLVLQKQTLPPKMSTLEKICQALVLGVRDYVLKSGFKKVLLGLSGGIDSALSLAIAVDALGAENVTAVSLPSRYTTALSIDMAKAQTQVQGVKLKIYSIEAAYQAFLNTLQEELTTPVSEIARQNCQSRCRGTMLMAMANANGALVLTTGNRSELAMGYTTLYGDMAGAFCVLKDVPKTLVYELSRFRNRIQMIIPQAVIDRAPSAELALHQKDEDSLPPYAVLDPILELYINQGLDVAEIVIRGFPEELVKKIVKQIHLNEYKRKQAPPGTRINAYAFGRDRRYPIVSRYHDE